MQTPAHFFPDNLFSNFFTKTKTKLVLLAILWLLTGCHASSVTSPDYSTQWVQTGPDGTYGHFITAIAVNGSSIFVGAASSGVGDSSGGVYRSTDNGSHWTKKSLGLPPTGPVGVGAFAVLGSNIFVGFPAPAGSSGGPYRSTDNGDSWTLASNGFFPNGPTFVNFNQVTAFAVIGSSLYGATGGLYDGVFLSKDSGKSWTGIGLADRFVTSLAVSGSNLFAGISSQTLSRDTMGVYLTTNNGTSWTAVHNGLPGTINESETTALAVSGTNLFAGIHGPGGGIYRSTDNGTHWTDMIASSTGFGPVYAFAVSSTNLFAATPGHLLLSKDSGESWTNCDTPLLHTAGVFSLSVSGTNLYAGTGSIGVWYCPLSAFQ